MRVFGLVLGLAVLMAGCASLQGDRRGVERIAVMSAFEPEMTALEGEIENRHDEVVNGVTFVTGKMAGKDVVLFMSGVSMVNAAMTTQMALDRYDIDRIVFSGVAGGVDPSLGVGDVAVAAQWGQYLEAAMARETAEGFQTPTMHRTPQDAFANFGMIFPASVPIARGDQPPERKFWFAADPAMLALAETVATGVTLKRCVESRCLSHQPKVVVGGNGVSGAAFVDNKKLREWAFSTFQARVLDMETAAVGHVAYVNRTPFIAFRSLSDLAGGEDGHNEAQTFYQLASENSAMVVKAFIAALP